MAAFRQALELTLKHEGGYSNHPLDNGGPTQYGITMTTLSLWRGAPVSVKDVEELGLGEATEIYRKKYWNVICGDDIRFQAMAEMLFDQAVNRGPMKAIKILQKAINARVDGVMGPETMSLINAKDFTVTYFKALQLSYVDIVVNTPSQAVFLKGWLRRTHGYLNG